ncbi:MAG TPA: hypothetical protein VE860_11050 [Chthoniobacterales bacterium]|jgi:hypothetical protein|nr:hypothetical protein [Chthoniobacterales bacterium]
MKDNIIDFRLPEEKREQGRKQHAKWIKIERDVAASLIDTLMVVWLGAWTLIASVEFLRVTGTALF